MATPTTAAAPGHRVDWVDYAKGFCIIMVVMLHSTFGVELAAGHEGFLHPFVMFAKPFRMPDFFLISGLFLARTIDRDWRTFTDKKVVHFAYFYFLWMTLQVAVKAPVFAAEQGWLGALHIYALSFVDPFGALWFIYMLPIFFVVTKGARQLGIPVIAVWLVAAALETAHVETGWMVIDEFASRFVYFYTGYLIAPKVFAFAAFVMRRPGVALAGLLAWALANGGVVYAGFSEWPLVSLVLGFAGAFAVITVSALMARSRLFEAVRYCGRNSIVIYLAFFLPMAATRVVLMKAGVIESVGAISLIVTAVAITGSLALWWATRGGRFDFLFERPAWAHIVPPRTAARLAPQPAE